MNYNLYKLMIAVTMVLISWLVVAPAHAVSGTGFFVSNDGYLITNWHVATADGQYQPNYVVVYDNKIYKATLVALSTKYDLAEYKIDTITPCLQIAERDNQFGDQVYLPILNYLKGWSQYAKVKVFSGRITNPETLIPMPDVIGYRDSFSFVPTVIRPGNSGSPVLNQSGQVIGVVWGAGTLGNKYIQALGVVNKDLVDFVQQPVVHASCPNPGGMGDSTVLIIELWNG